MAYTTILVHCERCHRQCIPWLGHGHGGCFRVQRLGEREPRATALSASSDPSVPIRVCLNMMTFKALGMCGKPKIERQSG
jgi:hypothetical protein